MGINVSKFTAKFSQLTKSVPIEKKVVAHIPAKDYMLTAELDKIAQSAATSIKKTTPDIQNTISKLSLEEKIKLGNSYDPVNFKKFANEAYKSGLSKELALDNALATVSATGKKANKSALESFADINAQKETNYLYKNHANKSATLSAHSFIVEGETKAEKTQKVLEMKERLQNKYHDALVQKARAKAEKANVELTKQRLQAKYADKLNK